MTVEGSKQPRLSAAPPPRTLNVQKFAESRASELETLHSVVAKRLDSDFRSRRNKRRRTASHDNRVTKNKSRKKQKVGVVDSSKKDILKNDRKKIPRYVRRKNEFKKNPVSGLSTSGDGTKRLRTHMWHAKRFTMTKLWGFHLPLGLQGRGKGSRALLKWVKQEAVVHDASYSSAVQLEGSEGSLLSILKAVLVPSASVHSEDICHNVLSGVICASAMLHHFEASSSRAIAPVTYMWQPLQERCAGLDAAGHDADGCDGPRNIDSCSSARRVWIWIHASAFREGYEVLRSVCQRQMDEAGGLINCISLEDQLATLEVMGSKASQLLQRILHPVSITSQHSSVVKKCSVAEDYSETRLKLTNFFENEDEVSSATVLSLTVSDPRVLIEKGVANVPEAVKGHNSVCLESEECSKLSDCMDLWGAPKWLCPPVEESVLCMEKRHQRLGFFCLGGHSSGEVNASTEGQFSRLCPILLLRSSNPNVSVLRCSIILPLSWVKAFWIPLISNGAHAIGLREKHWIACEGGLPYFPSDFPDCNAYSSFMATKAAASGQDASRRPSSMRPLRVPIPPPWDSICFSLNKKSILLGDSQSRPGELCAENVVHDHPLTSSSSGVRGIPAVSGHGVPLQGIVARTPCMLVHFLHSISGDHLLLFPAVPDKKKCISKSMKDEVVLSQGSSRVISPVKNDKRLCFLRVLLQAFKEGVFEEGAVVCAPHPTDITLWTSGTDKNVELQITQSSLRSYFAQQPSGKWEVREPEDPKAREFHRRPIGFVTSGFVRGSKRPVAGALCEAVSLACLREEQWKAVPAQKRREEIYVLVRNLKSTAYRLALASIALEHHKADMEYM